MIKIRKEADIEISQADYERYQHEYNNAFTYYSDARPSFETWLRGRLKPASTGEEG